jgi:hypothetical protein
VKSVCPSSVVCSVPFLASQSRAVQSSLAVIMRVPSLENAQLVTQPECAPSSVVCSAPVSASQRRAGLSLLAVTTRVPSGENAQLVTTLNPSV